MWEKGVYRPWCLFEGPEIIGEGFLLLGLPGWAVLDYLCVSSRRRNRGLGSLLLKKILEAERGNVILGESEVPAFASDPEMAQRRLGFYARNGAQRAGYDMAQYGVPYHTLYWAERKISDEELLAHHRKLYQRWFSPQRYAKYIRLPLTQEMSAELVPWEEGEED